MNNSIMFLFCHSLSRPAHQISSSPGTKRVLRVYIAYFAFWIFFSVHIPILLIGIFISNTNNHFVILLISVSIPDFHFTDLCVCITMYVLGLGI